MASITSPSLPLQAAVFAALTTDPRMIAAFLALAANAGAPRVYDTVPADPAGVITALFPYLTIGEDQIVPVTPQITDEAFVQVQIWSRPTVDVDYGELKTLEGVARDILSQALPVAGFQTCTWRFHGSIPRKEPDGVTRRQILTMSYLLSPAAGLAIA